MVTKRTIAGRRIGIIREFGLFLIFLFSYSLIFLFSSCTSGELPEMPVVEEPVKETVTMELMPCMPYYREIMAPTRAWIPPTGYYYYGDLSGPGGMFENQADLTNKTIGIAFTQDAQPSAEPPVPATVKKGYFIFFKGSSSAEDLWTTSVEDIKTETYYLYGYIPYQGNVPFDVMPDAESGKFSEGAMLTIRNLSTVTPNDVCVVVGAKNGKDNGYIDDPLVDYSITGLQPGDFKYVAEGATGDPPEAHGNFVYLLFDHLFSAMRFRFKVHEDYDKLRTIKLKELQLWPFTEPANPDDPPVPSRLKTNVTITLKANTTGESPIQSVEFTPTGGEFEYKKGENLIFQNSSGVPLTTDYSEGYMGKVMPQGVYRLLLRSTYDIYDKQGNLIRQNSKADNVIVLKNMEFYPPQTTATRGTCYTINLTVKPTYLYVMSDPDLENPTVEVD